MGVRKNKGEGQVILIQVGAKSVNIKMATTDTADKQRLIKKRKFDEMICGLETADRSELLEKVIDVGSSYHVTHFCDRKQRWNAIVTTSKDCLLKLVLVLYQLYIDKLQLCRKGKEKFTRLQLAWMETM